MAKIGRSCRRAAVVVAVTSGLLACGADSTKRTTASSSPAPATAVPTSAAPTSVATPSTIDDSVQHFDTPEAAMRYLAAAWNADDQVALRHVTDPSARDQLDGMHAEAANL